MWSDSPKFPITHLLIRAHLCLLQLKHLFPEFLFLFIWSNHQYHSSLDHDHPNHVFLCYYLFKTLMKLYRYHCSTYLQLFINSCDPFLLLFQHLISILLHYFMRKLIEAYLHLIISNFILNANSFHVLVINLCVLNFEFNQLFDHYLLSPLNLMTLIYPLHKVHYRNFLLIMSLHDPQ